jgi:hypothetical protein
MSKQNERTNTQQRTKQKAEQNKHHSRSQSTQVVVNDASAAQRNTRGVSAPQSRRHHRRRVRGVVRVQLNCGGFCFFCFLCLFLSKVAY